MSAPAIDRLSAALKRVRTVFLWASLCGLFINLLVLTVPLYMMQIFDRVVVSRSLSSLLWLTVIALGALAVYGIFEMLRSRLLVRLTIWLDEAMAPAVFERGLEAGLRGHAYASEALRDLTTVRQYLGGGALALLDAPWMPLFLGLIFLLHPVLGLVAVAGGLALVLLAYITEKVLHGDLKSANLAAFRAQRVAEMAVRNAEVVDAMGMNAAVADRWAVESTRVNEFQARASDRSSTINAVSKATRLVLQLAILGVGGYYVVLNELSAGAMIAASIIMGRALAPVEMAIGSWRQASGALDAYRRLKGFLQTAPLREESLPLPRPAARLTVENVTYHPIGASEPVVRDVSFELEPGEAIGIIGPSAAGKSSLARMLIGTAQPTRGAVRLDGANLFRWNRDDVGNWVGYLPQDVELFEGTVRDNIARLADVHSEDIVGAARMAGAHEMILRLPKGYETDIGAARLSGGQRQRIGLARALLGQPVLTVLDEPNSNLDNEGEMALNEAVARLKEQGSIVVIIGHRPSVMTHVDKLIVLHQGRVQLYGAKKQVLEQLTRQTVSAVPAPSAAGKGVALEKRS
ncbi:MAG: type I secretion system permease/ATPase [Reyranella sp.]|nr:type I secretion system permease/ATPase [Reyranella sp.]